MGLGLQPIHRADGLVLSLTGNPAAPHPAGSHSNGENSRITESPIRAKNGRSS
jgi:hypothetical protein